MLVPLGPEPFIGGTDLSRHIAGHLRRQGVTLTHLGIRRFLQTNGITRFPMSKCVGTDEIQRLAVSQLGLSEQRQLVGCRLQFQLGGQWLSRRTSVRYFGVTVKRGGALSPPT